MVKLQSLLFLSKSVLKKKQYPKKPRVLKNLRFKRWNKRFKWIMVRYYGKKLKLQKLKKLKRLKKLKKKKNIMDFFVIFDQNKNCKLTYNLPKLNWLIQKFICRLMYGGNKQQLETKILKIYEMGYVKKKRYNFQKQFFSAFFDKIKKFRPRIELCKKKRRLGKTSAIEKERMRRTKINRFLIPNCMSRQKQLQTVLIWIINEIRSTGLRKLKIEEKPIKLDPNKKMRAKNPIKGRKNLLMAVKAAKKKRQLEKLKIKEKKRYKVYPIKRQIKKILINIFFKKQKKSFLFEKSNQYIELLGKQSFLRGLRRWK